MNVFENRKDNQYIDYLKNTLELENLKESAIHISKPKTIDGIEYDKFIRIDLLSITGSTLLDESYYLDEVNVFEEFKTLLTNTEKLKQSGFFIKVRILLEYPYSESSLSRIQAEGTSQRATIKEPNFSRNFDLLEQIDEDLFNSSFMVNLQKSNLRNLQNLEKELRENHGWNSRNNPSSITLKFAPFGLGTCALIINNKLIFDSYLYAKNRKSERKLSINSPVIVLNKLENESSFVAFEDHFRYCWDLDMTLDCEDATYYNPNKVRSLSKIRHPQAVSFENKANRICNLKNMCGDEKTITNWKKQIVNHFNKYVTDLSPTIANETVFITCSWQKKDDDVASPNEYAKLLNDFLVHDYSNSEPPVFSVQIMQATPSEFLSTQLYQALDSSTIGIVLMTKDIESDGKFYCKPNVYHELGYLMKQLGKNRIIILKENGVETPSNIADIIRFDFSSDKISFRYHDIVELLNLMLTIPKDISVKSLDSHVDRLNDFLKDGKIESKEFKTLQSRIVQVKHRINTG